MALPALLLVLAMAVTVQSVVGTRASCADAARAGARAAARGESDAVVTRTVRQVLPRTETVRVAREGSFVRVEVVARPALVTPRFSAPLVSAVATAADEVASS